MIPTSNSDLVAKILGTYTDPIPDALLKAFETNNCVLFAGSGVSRRCLARNRRPLPNWPELLHVLLSWANEKKLVTSETHFELRDLITKNEYLMVAQEMLEVLGEDTVQSIVTEALDPDGIVPSRLHELLAITPFRFSITTNYDSLIERAFVSMRNRHIERVCLDELKRLGSLLQQELEFVLKLHGDLERPETIILGQRQYQFLLQNSEYSDVLEGIFKENSVLMLGYGLGDIDLQLTLDRLARNCGRSHFLLCAKGTKTNIEKKRLAADRNVHIIEYVDYFGYHNHLDTFLKAVNVALGNDNNLHRVRRELRARIAIHYPLTLAEDGLLVWNLLFREGAITLSEGAQKEQLIYLDKRLSENLQALDYLLFVVDDNALAKRSSFLPVLKRALKSASSQGVQPLFLIIGSDRRPTFISTKINAPTFYVKNGFSEKDLTLLRSYIAQDIQMGYRQR